MGAYLSHWYRSYLEPRPTQVEVDVDGYCQRIKNAAKNNFRGIIGFFVPLFCFTPMLGRDGYKTVQVMWLTMFWCLLFHPVSVPVSGIIPLFTLPLLGVMSSQLVCASYFGDDLALFVLGGMFCLLLNNAGFDRRVIVNILSCGSGCSPASLVCKASFAAFLLSIFSNRLIITGTIIGIVAPALSTMPGVAPDTTQPENDADYKKLRNIVCCAIQTSAGIGSLVIVHCSFAVMTMRCLWSEQILHKELFNYLQYSLFALPTAILMYIFNLFYYLIMAATMKKMSPTSVIKLRDQIKKQKQSLTHVTCHEAYSVIFTIIGCLMFFTRIFKYPNGNGWGKLFDWRLTDASVAAILVILLHMLPNNCVFFKVCTVNKRSELGPIKPASAILWWRFVDKNTVYGYILLIGGGVALNKAIRHSDLGIYFATGVGSWFPAMGWVGGVMVGMLLVVILANMMTCVAVLVMVLPYILNMGIAEADVRWSEYLYVPVLGAAQAASLGFMCPFLYTPAYFCHYLGEVPRCKMALYTLPSVIICYLLLALMLLFYAPWLWGTLSV